MVLFRNSIAPFFREPVARVLQGRARCLTVVERGIWTGERKHRSTRKGCDHGDFGGVSGSRIGKRSSKARARVTAGGIGC